MSRQELIIEPPVRGYWAIYNPPGHSPLAFDILAVDEQKSLYRKGGFLRHLVSSIPVEDTFAWTSPVLSPVDGVVTASLGTAGDRRKISFLYDLLSLLISNPKESDGFGAFGGNHVIIRTADVHVLLCHLQQGSVTVSKDDTVRAGQQVGRVGNSGSSVQPHLHLQVMSNDRYFPLFANLLPFRISQGMIKQNSTWTVQRNFELQNKGHYLFES